MSFLRWQPLHRVYDNVTVRVLVADLDVAALAFLEAKRAKRDEQLVNRRRLLLVTALLVIGRDPKSTLAVLTFLVIIAAALRLSLPLVYAATLGAMAAYAFFLGYVRFGLHVADNERLSRPQQIVFLLALGAAGLLAGQVVRQVRRLLQGYPVQVADEQEKT